MKNKKVMYSKYEFPRRNKPLGKTKGSTQGVASWRSKYFDLKEWERMKQVPARVIL